MKVTPAAVEALQSIIRANPELTGFPVRLYLEAQASGCGPGAPRIRAGFDDETPAAADTVWNQGGLTFVMTKREALFLDRFELDYSSDSEEKGFICRR